MGAAPRAEVALASADTTVCGGTQNQEKSAIAPRTCPDILARVRPNGPLPEARPRGLSLRTSASDKASATSARKLSRTLPQTVRFDLCSSLCAAAPPHPPCLSPKLCVLCCNSLFVPYLSFSPWDFLISPTSTSLFHYLFALCLHKFILLLVNRLCIPCTLFIRTQPPCVH